MICHSKKCIFVHIPKCGGSSIEAILWPRPEDRTEDNLYNGLLDGFNNKYQTGGLQHLMAQQIRTEVGAGIFDQYFKFSIVRNPWDKAVSQYVYIMKRPDLRAYLGMSKNDDFKSYLRLTDRKTHVQWEPQHKFVYDDGGNLMVDYVGRFENFEADVHTILDRLALEIDTLPHEKKGKRRKYTDYYDAESMKIVAMKYQGDIDRFGYSFGD